MNLANQTVFLTTLLYLTVQGCCIDQTKTGFEIAKTESVPPSTQPQIAVATDAKPMAKVLEQDDSQGQEAPPGNQSEAGNNNGAEGTSTAPKTEESKGGGDSSPPPPSAPSTKVDNEGKKVDNKGKKEKAKKKSGDDEPQTGTAKEENATVTGAGQFPPPQIASVAVTVKYYYRHKEDTGFFEKLEPNSQLFSGDLYALKLTLAEDGYLYVYQTGGDGKIQDLMANSKKEKKVAGGKTLVLPAEMEAFFLDDVTGQEEIYVLVFKQRNTMLENQYATLSNNGGDKAKLQEEMLNTLRETAKEKVTFKHDKKTNTEETQP